MSELREEIRKILSGAAAARPAALRRSLREDFLYAADLPRIASEAETAAFCQQAEQAGWRTEMDGGWIQLDRIPQSVPANALPAVFGPEAECCLSLLRRHPGNRKNGDKEKRLLLKAGEESPRAYEKACRTLHREWAAALRKAEPLPDLPEEFFTKQKA